MKISVLAEMKQKKESESYLAFSVANEEERAVQGRGSGDERPAQRHGEVWVLALDGTLEEKRPNVNMLQS
jgi:hypothetical protein